MQLLAANELDQLANRKHLRVAHARNVMHGCEACATVDDHQRDEMLQAEIGDGAVVDDAQARSRHVDPDALYIVGAHARLLKQGRH